MKKFLISILAFFIVLVGVGFALISIDWNRLNKDHYYVQITERPAIDEFIDAKGAVYENFSYTLPAYDEEGNMQLLDFSAHKELRANAYLMLYVKDSDVVTSYDEVQLDDMPANVKKHFEQ